MLSIEATSKIYDCLILSGGGAKGAYGAGVAKALDVFRTYRGIDHSVCYVGASAGALNAYMLASGSPDQLIDFWLEATNLSVLGVIVRNARFQGLKRWVLTFASASPYSIYSNQALRSLISKTASLKTLKSPLILACTDYTQGALAAFYSSDLIEKLVQEDAREPASRRRLGHFRKIESDKMLVDALLASSAIPVFFPPVRIRSTAGGAPSASWYVDGGVGNHTPTREAAYFFRYLEEMRLGKSGTAFCVSQDPPRTIQESEQLDFSDILKRTMEVYHNVHTKPIVTAWKRINVEVAEILKKLAKFEEWVNALDLSEEARRDIIREVGEQFGKMGGRTPRLGVPLVEIEPSVPLGDALNFDPARARENIEHGFTDTLKTLRGTRDRSEGAPNDRTLLDAAEFDTLLSTRLFSNAS
jgi:predicted acylesterase/phospholipase RssA